ncbi:hypothetical protein SAMN04488079_11681 [Methylophaga sulfidovorans]|uniref:Uncharacterized protein n=1 Tax=Methylophaga sulfidovorans TaxID=45496 RepID=A0A1I4AZB5_9GAMM|nr:hypothetical protein SAMN04488079_11681 [Methylophaga sulfidovorans]
MSNSEDKVDALLAKHPNLTKEEVIQLLKDKNERKKKKRADKSERMSAKIFRNEEN